MHARPSVRHTIEGPAGELEARIDAPAEDQEPVAVAVICHPHPLHGGTLEHKVPFTVARALQGLGAAAVRFNFRGVGRSGGSYGEGVGEVDDAIAVIEWAREHWQLDRLWLGGFSFGAAVAFSAALRTPAERLVTVAPPVQRLAMPTASRPDCEWLVLQGSNDELVEAAAVQAWLRSFRPPPRFELLEGADHFFHGRLADVRRVVTEFFGASK
jgi:alpha/beta superfamily hydrolase